MYLLLLRSYLTIALPRETRSSNILIFLSYYTVPLRYWALFYLLQTLQTFSVYMFIVARSPCWSKVLKCPWPFGQKKSQKYFTTHTNMSRRNEVKTCFRFRFMSLWILIFFKKFAQEETRNYDICDVIYGTEVCRGFLSV